MADMANLSKAQVPDTTAGRDAVLGAALQAFFEHGFHGTSMRNIAARAGTAVSHAYYYFPSMNDLLRTLVVGVTGDLIALLKAAQAEAGTDPGEQMHAIVQAHVTLHTERQAEAFVGNTELRSLTPEDRDIAVALRDQISTLFRVVIENGQKQGGFHCPHREEAVLAIVTMCTAVAGWYRPEGPLTAATIAERYGNLALNMVGYEDTQNRKRIAS